MIRETIKETFKEVVEQTGAQLKVDNFADDMVLLESGLDSLGFAILVAALELKLNYDPFTLMEEPVYPKTFGEFVHIYEVMNPNA